RAAPLAGLPRRPAGRGAGHVGRRRPAAPEHPGAGRLRLRHAAGLGRRHGRRAGPAPQVGPVPRAGLNAERVAAEAAAVADEVGLDRLTLAAVAQRLGVSLPSLYKHVRGLDGLRRDLSVLSVRELTGVLSAAAVGRSGRDGLVAIAAAYREYARAHPGRAAATVRAPDPGDAEYLAVAAG